MQNEQPLAVNAFEAAASDSAAGSSDLEAGEPRSRFKLVYTGIIDRNPFYLFSGCAMLVGCFLLNFGLTAENPDRFDWMLALLGVFNLYELAVIAVLLWLRRDLIMRRDVVMLIVLEVLLLSDVTFLYHRASTFSVAMGAWVCGVAWLAAMIKLGVVFYMLGARLRWAGWMILALDLAALLLGGVGWAMMVNLNWMGDEALYVSWWVAAVLIALRGVRWTRPPHPSLQRNLLPAIAIGAARSVPLAVLLVHLFAAHMTYTVPLSLYHIAPLMLGGAAWLAIGRVRPGERPQRRVVIAALGVVAVLLSLGGPAWGEDYLTTTPLRNSLVMLSFVWLLAWWRLGGMPLPFGASLSAATALLGHDLTTIADRARDATQAVLPDSLSQWGWLSVAAAFVLLAAGAAVSWLQRGRARIGREG
ncbi:MAG: hypothetical protein MI741_23485 [Rhodospirillales bacterium]|nr:hypothetical protein [Rhodospirillales bacterium]